MNTRPLFAAACGDSVLDAKSAHDSGKGTIVAYDAPYDQVWAAAHAAVRWNGAGTPADHSDQHYFITDPAHFDQIGVFIEPEGDKSRVTVVVIDDQSLPGPNEKSVQKDIATALELAKAGKPTDKRP